MNLDYFHKSLGNLMIKEVYTKAFEVSNHFQLKNDQMCWTYLNFFDHKDLGNVSFNTSQSVPCGALLVYCCHSYCLGRHGGHRNPGDRGTDHRSLTSLKAISWQLAEAKLAICSR